MYIFVSVGYGWTPVVPGGSDTAIFDLDKCSTLLHIIDREKYLSLMVFFQPHQGNVPI